MKPAKVKCYGDAAALTVEESVNSGNSLTINLELARIIDGTGPTNHYDWANKVIFQLSSSDLYMFAGLLLGYIPSFRIEKKGEKWIEFERQRRGSDGKGYGSLYIKGCAKGGKLCTLPAPPGKVAELSQLVLGRIEKRTECSPELLIASIKGGCALLT